MYYLIAKNNTWTNEAMTTAQIEAKGCKVEETRVSFADKKMTLNGTACGFLFTSQAAQVAHLAHLGLI